LPISIANRSGEQLSSRMEVKTPSRVGAVWAMAALLLLVYVPLYPSLVETWISDSNNSHGMLIPVVFLYLLWQMKDRLTLVAMEREPAIFGLILLMGSLLCYYISYVADLAFFARLTMITTLGGVILFNYGWKLFRLVLAPMLFLFFMVPVPESFLDLIAFPLQLFVTDASAHLIDFYGIPVNMEGNRLFFPNYSFEVTEACSGIRSLVSFLAIGVLFAYLDETSVWKRLVLILSVVPLAIFINLVRVTGTGVLAHYFGPSIARGFLHDFSGFIVFAAGIVFMTGEMWVLNKMGRRREGNR
jgi:exosortase